jgi:hypothetical protein
VERISKERTVNNGIKNKPKGRRSVETTRKRWLDDVENDPKKMGVKRPEKNS